MKFFNEKLINTISVVNNCISSRRSYVASPYIPTCKYTLRLLFKLKWIGCLSSVDLILHKDQFWASVVVNCRDKWPVYKKITVLSTQHKRLFWEFRDVKLFSHSGITYILSTDQGLLTDKEAIESRIGGLVLCSLVRR